jgi:NhaP-type Na+/H+ or K+/H+ antiporter
VAADPILVLAGLAGGGVAAQWVAWRLRIPVILVLLVAGVAVGPGFGLLDPDEVLGDLLLPAVSLSVGVILFEGALGLGSTELRSAGRAARNLVTIGAAITFGAASLLAWLVLDVELSIACLIGAVVVVTGPTVIGPLLRQVRPRGRAGSVLRTEGIIIDPIGAVLALLVFEVAVAEQGGDAIGRVALTLAEVMGSGTVVGLAGAALVWAVLRWYLLPDHLEQAGVLGTVLVTFAVADHLQEESGLLAVTVMGLALANQRRVSVERVVEFNQTLQVLLVSGLFLVLAARLDLEALRDQLGPNLLLVAGLVLVIRPLSVWVSTWRTGLTTRERLFVSVVAPRGIVAAAVSSVFALRLDEAGLPGGQELAGSVVIVIVATIVVAGLAARPVARAFDLAEAEPTGVLVLGAHGWGRELAATLEAHGVRCKLVERDRERATTARLQGREVHFGSILADHTVETLEADGIGHLLAVTGSDEVNALAAQRLRERFGSGRVWRLPPVGEDDHRGHRHRLSFHLPGRHLFAPWATAAAIDARVEGGARVKATRLTDAFDWDAYRHRNPDALPMVLVRDGAPVVVPADREVRPRPGDVVVALAFPET